jgi:hypothetical protein
MVMDLKQNASPLPPMEKSKVVEKEKGELDALRRWFTKNSKNE